MPVWGTGRLSYCECVLSTKGGNKGPQKEKSLPVQVCVRARMRACLRSFVLCCREAGLRAGTMLAACLAAKSAAAGCIWQQPIWPPVCCAQQAGSSAEACFDCSGNFRWECGGAGNPKSAAKCHKNNTTIPVEWPGSGGYHSCESCPNGLRSAWDSLHTMGMSSIILALSAFF